jgi:hypothetical protein
MLLFGLVQIAVGIFMWLRPERIYGTFSNFPSNTPYATNLVSYFLGISGALFIAGGLLVIFGAVRPARNLNAVRFAILWSLLSLSSQIYAIVKHYVTLGEVVWSLAVFLFFLVVFILFYPWPWRPDSHRGLPGD